MSNHKIPKRYHIFIVVSVLLLLYTCFVQIDRNEISNVHFIQILCIDKTEDGFMVSALYNDAGSEEEISLQFAKGEGNTVFTAFEDLKRKDSKELTITHTAYYLLSTKAAQYSLPKCMDFISRDESAKTNASVYILKADNVNKVMDKAVKDQFLPHKVLSSIAQKQAHNLKKIDNTLLTVLNNMNNSYNNLLIPALAYKNKSLYIDGYATFKDAKLYEYLDYSTSQAIDLFRNRLNNYSLTLENDMSVLLSELKVAQHIQLNQKNIDLTLAIQMNSELKETNETQNVFNNKSLSAIKKMEENMLYSQFSHIIFLIQKNKLDLLDIGTYLSNESPEAKDSYARNWDYYLQNIEYKLNVDSTIAKNYIITK